MNAHERIWKALSHEEPDRVPTFAQHIEGPFIEKYDAMFEIQDDYGFGGLYDLALAKEIGLDSKWQHGMGGYVVPAKEQRPELPPDLAKKFEGKHVSDQGHVHEWSKTAEGSWYIDGVVKTPELIEEWVGFINTFRPADEEVFRSWKPVWDNGLDQDMVPIPTTVGPTYVTWSAIGLDRLAYILRKHPDSFKKLFHAWVNVAMSVQTCLFETGMDMVFFCDDHCYKDRCMFSPKQFNEFIVPEFKRMADNAHKHGAKVFVHSDGYLTEEMPLLIKAGMDAAEPMEWEANNRLGPLKDLCRGKITLIGNVGASDYLSFGTVEDTIRLTKQLILEVADGGGFILAPGSDVLGTCKPENVKAMVNTVKKYGGYPIDRSKLV